MKRPLVIALLGASVLIALHPLRPWLERPARAANEVGGQLHSRHAAAIDTRRYNALLADACSRQRHCDQPARLLAGHAPHYPPQAYAQGREGHALMRFDILADGSTGSIHSLSSSDPAFAQAARQAIAGWRLQPARFQGRELPQASIELQFAITP